METSFLVLTALMIVYLIRHYIFTLTVLKNAQRRKENVTLENGKYQPTVSILIPHITRKK
jgi:hypothetical protein